MLVTERIESKDLLSVPGLCRDGHRGNGIGHHLVSRAREIARTAGCDYLSVSAATGNFAAHRFYEQLDFRPRPVTGMRYMQAIA